MKGQPLAYNKDNQEDKEPLFDTVDTVRDCLAVFADLVAGMRPVPERMRAAALEGFATATDLADYLVGKGVPFRDAHEIVAQAVREAEKKGLRPVRFAPARAQAFFARHRGGRIRLADAGGLGRAPQAPRRHRACAGPARRGARQEKDGERMSDSALAGAGRQIPGNQIARGRGELGGVPVQRPVQRPRRCGQGRFHRPVRGPHARQAVQEAVRQRGLARRQTPASAHRADLRRGRRGKAQLHRDGVRRRRDAGEVLRPGKPAAHRAGRGDGLQVHARARVRAPQGHHPPRHQAGEYPARRRLGR